MKLAALVSGGKDSLYALSKASEEHEIKYLICAKAKENSELLHSENLDLVKLQSKTLGIPLIWRKGSGEGTKPLREAIEAVKDDVDGVVSGAVASNYQKKKVEGICGRFGLENLMPLWGMDEHELIKSLIEEDFEVLFVKVAAQGLDKEWLGRKLDEDSISDLERLEDKYGIHVAGEGGEYETLVVDCPVFSHRMEVKEEDIRWNPKTKTGYLDIMSAKLERK